MKKIKFINLNQKNTIHQRIQSITQTAFVKIMVQLCGQTVNYKLNYACKINYVHRSIQRWTLAVMKNCAIQITIQTTTEVTAQLHTLSIIQWSSQQIKRHCSNINAIYLASIQTSNAINHAVNRKLNVKLNIRLNSIKRKINH